ncbi:MAG: hypothetical protein ACOZNI_21390 [Myxococcota bacterium]
MTNLLLSCVLASSLARAGDGDGEPKFPVVKPSGVIFTHYGYDLTDGADGFNEFALDRAYVRVDADIAKRWATRVTLDADHVATTDSAGDAVDVSKLRVFVKHAYVEARDFGLPGVKIRGGMIETAYAPWWDNFWGNRYLAESFPKEAGLMDTADLGIGAWGKHAKGAVDWNLSLVDGEGYKNLEDDKGKQVMARVTVNPLAKGGKASLPITGFASWDTDAVAKTSTVNAIGGAGFEIPRLLVWGEFDYTTTDGTSGTGYSATLNPRLPKYAGLVVRYDHFDPDTGASGDSGDRILAGVEKDFLEKVSLGLMYERGWAEGAADTPSHGVFLRAQAGY